MELKTEFPLAEILQGRTKLRFKYDLDAAHALQSRQRVFSNEFEIADPAVEPVVIRTNLELYPLGSVVDLTVTNVSKEDLWLIPSCGTLTYAIFQKKGEEWKSHGAHPTKDCDSPSVQLAAGGEFKIEIDLKQTFEYQSFKMEQGIYKFGLQYLNKRKGDGRMESWGVFSNEFLLE